MTGKKLRDLKIETNQQPNYVYVKQPIFSFSQLPGVDPILNSTMKSTGEVMGVGHNLAEATAKAFLSILKKKPKERTVLIRINIYEELEVIPIINELINLGYKIRLASENKQIVRNCNFSEKFMKIIEFKKETLTNDYFFNDIFLVINTLSKDHAETYHKNYRKIILKHNIIECTTIQHAKGLVRALQFYHLNNLNPVPLSLKGKTRNFSNVSGIKSFT